MIELGRDRCLELLEARERDLSLSAPEFFCKYGVKDPKKVYDSLSVHGLRGAWDKLMAQKQRKSVKRAREEKLVREKVDEVKETGTETETETETEQVHRDLLSTEKETRPGEASLPGGAGALLASRIVRSVEAAPPTEPPTEAPTQPEAVECLPARKKEEGVPEENGAEEKEEAKETPDKPNWKPYLVAAAVVAVLGLGLSLFRRKDDERSAALIPEGGVLPLGEEQASGIDRQTDSPNGVEMSPVVNDSVQPATAGLGRRKDLASVELGKYSKLAGRML